MEHLYAKSVANMNEILKSAVDAGPVVAGFATVGTLFVAYKVGKVSTTTMMIIFVHVISILNYLVLIGRSQTCPVRHWSLSTRCFFDPERISRNLGSGVSSLEPLMESAKRIP